VAAQPTYNAEAYERGRPGYSEPAVARLLDALEIDANSVVLDLAAGTGKFTGELVAVAGSVIAVEPEPHMRAELARGLPMVDVRDGHATNIPVPDGAVDAVTVAQAFHWFAGREALDEIARVLRAGGRLGLIWNVRDLETPVQQALEEILVVYRGAGPPKYHGSPWRDVFTDDGPFGPLHAAEFQLTHPVNQEEFEALVLSMSFTSQLDDAQRAVVGRSVAAVFAEHANGGEPALVEVPYVTRVFWTEERSGT
jgi:SAM-dependent methyltransferase